MAVGTTGVLIDEAGNCRKYRFSKLKERFEVDLGAYVAQDYDDPFRGRSQAQLSVGLSVSF